MALKNTVNLSLLRHYDKIIVVTVLIVLLISLAYLVTAGVARKQNEAAFMESLESLRPKQAVADAMPLESYQSVARQFKKPAQLVVDANTEANFITPERRVSCVNAGCTKPIPFNAKVCPFCGAQQPIPPELDPSLDSMGDGIPDRVKVELGLDPANKDAIHQDLDNDGFSVLEEYKAKTDPKDSKSHPAYSVKLRVKEIKSKRLPLTLMGVNTMPGGQKQLTFELIGPPRRTLWIKENEAIEKTGYVAGKVDVKFEERNNPLTPGIKTRVDVSSVPLKRTSDGKVFTVRINEVGKHTDVEAALVLTIDNTEYTVLEKTEFKVRDETYRVIAVNADAGTVTVENLGNGKLSTIQKLD